MKIFNNIIKSPLFKITSLNSLSVIVRILGGLVSSKIVAIFIGPAGLALTGNLRNFMAAIDTFSTLGFQNGIIKHVAEQEKSKERLKAILTTVFLITIAAITVIAVFLSFSRFYWSELLFKTTEYNWLFLVIALCLPLYAGNIVIIAVLNGLSEYKPVIKTNIAGNIIAVILSSVLIYIYGLKGALLSLVIAPSAVFFFSCYLLQKRLDLLKFFKVSFFQVSVLKPLFSYSLMALVTAILGQLIYFLIRNRIITISGIEDAGHWEGINRLSGYYLLFVSTLLTVYFLPKLSQAKTNSETQQVFMSYYKGIVPVFAIGLIVIYFLKEAIIKILLAKTFLPMADLFMWQLIGDFLKVCSLILGYEFFAKKMTKVFIVTEVISFTILYTTSMYLIAQYGNEGAVMAHTATYFIYFLILTFFFRKKIFNK